MTFIKDEMKFLDLPTVHHTLYDTDFTEVIEIHYGTPFTAGYIAKFISIYEDRGLNPIPNIIKFITQEILFAQEDYFQYIIDNYPQYADQMRKYLLLL
jgi:hypothetical protein